MTVASLLIQASASHLPLRDASVQCVVTSPPYWGLRQYAGEQRQVWGGDSGHAHEWGWATKPGQSGGTASAKVQTKGTDNFQIVPPSEHGFCSCGAWYGALGLEPTPELYVEHMVEVFREVRRVLRADGTLFLNLGDSYASTGGERAYGSYDGATGRGPGTRRYRGSTSGSDARPYGTSDTVPGGSTDRDSSSPDLCDACEAALALRTAHNGTLLVPTRDGDSPDPNPARTESARVRPASAGSSRLTPTPQSAAANQDRQQTQVRAASLPLDARESTSPESAPQPPGGCSHCGNCGACLSVLRSSSRDARLCARRSDGTGDTSVRESAGRIDRMGASGLAYPYSTMPSLLKPKDLVGIPWMVAFALRADGWYLRSDIIWAKPNPMPESVTDRPTKAHEYLFLLSKSERYFYDADAIREPVAESSIQRISQNDGHPKFEAARARRGEGHIGGNDTLRADQLVPTGGRNKRSVWTVATQPYAGAHFATFPEALVEPCILAGSSPQACGVCGAPWARVTERQGIESRAVGKSLKKREQGLRTQFSGAAPGTPTSPTITTLGWRPTCAHEDGGGTCVVLDPFNGSGTTGRVAVRHGRSYVGVDISREYLAEQATKRIGGVQHVMGGIR